MSIRIAMVRLVLGVGALGASAYFLSVLLRSKARAVSTFIAALLVLFHSVFWLQVARADITYFSVLIPVLVCAFLLWRLAAGSDAALRPRLPAWKPPALPERILLMTIVVAGLVMATRCLAQPLYGWDTPFRWHFLAVRILEQQSLWFYPPVEEHDFAYYFYPDGIPPLVSIAYFWLYSAFGRAVPLLAGFFVVTQVLVLADLCRRTAGHLFGAAAGVHALAIAASSSLLFLALFWGQETGLTAISLVATLYFIVTANDGKDERAMVLAGAAAALGALAREYGCIFLVCGGLTCLWERRPRRDVAVFAAAFGLLAAPWYIRSWIVAGNPFYSNPASGALFHVNEVHSGILAAYSRVLGFSTNMGPYMRFVWPYLLVTAPLQLVLGLTGAMAFGRRLGYAALSCLVVILLWIYSVGQTAGGIAYAMRVMSPALAVLSILGAGLLARVRVPRVQALLVTPILCAFCLFGALQDVIMPTSVFGVHPRGWGSLAFSRPDRTDHEFLRALTLLPPSAQILGHNAYQYASLETSREQPGQHLYPVWSPSFSFLFDPSVPAHVAADRLAGAGITHIIHSPRSKNNFYLHRFPFFRDLPQYCTLVYEAKRGWLLLELTVPADTPQPPPADP